MGQFYCHTEIICIKTQHVARALVRVLHCHTEIICIKTQQTVTRSSSLPTVTQKSFASKHNRSVPAEPRSSLSHRNHLHQNTTGRAFPIPLIHCHTEIICIKTQQLRVRLCLLDTVTQKSFASKHNQVKRKKLSKSTVTQKSFASKHNSAGMVASNLATVTQKSFASKHNTKEIILELTPLSHRNHLHQNTTTCSVWLMPSKLSHRNHLHQNTTGMNTYIVEP